MTRPGFARFAMLICSALTGMCHADAISDLKNALAKEQVKAPLHANFEIRTWNKEGDDKQTDDKHGIATIGVEDTNAGLQLLFGRDMLNKLESEQRAKQKDHTAVTPTVNAADAINTKAVQEMTSAASVMLAWLDKAVYQSERLDSYNGKPARLLSFVYTENNLTPKEREHMKKYEGGAELWIADDGTPLAWKSHEVLTASFMVLVTFDIMNEESATFALVNDRLIATHRETRQKGSGLGQKGEGTVSRYLTVLP